MNLIDMIRHYNKVIYDLDKSAKNEERVREAEELLFYLNKLFKIQHIIEDAKDDIKSAPSKIDVAIVKRMAFDDILEKVDEVYD